MPTYHFKNTFNGLETTQFMSISDYEIFIVEHPHLEQLPPSVVNLGDPHLLGLNKPRGAFRERLTDIKHGHRGSVINNF